MGYIFTIDTENREIINITAYNQFRYLVARNTLVYREKKASEVVKMIAGEFKIDIGEIEDTKYIIPYRIEENKTIFDIIYNALDMTSKAGFKNYILFDDKGKLCLKSYEKMKEDLVLEDIDAFLGYRYKSSIDKNVYNSIKVSTKDRKTKLISTYLVEDENSKKEFGTLRLFKRLGNEYNSIQAKDYAKNILESNKKKEEKISITCFGNSKIFAGKIISFKFGENILPMIVEKCVHSIKCGEHIMSLELRKI